MIDHVGFEVSDLARSARFYDALFAPLGGRRVFDGEAAIGYGVHEARLFIVARGRRTLVCVGGPVYGRTDRTRRPEEPPWPARSTPT